MKTQITVKEVEEKTFQELKSEAANMKMSIGAALTIAIESWLSSIRKPKGSLLKWKPRDWGPGTENLSEQVDEIIYGDS
ncbi:MAG: hypothetical protein AABW52_00025 [Nanoarchaeota archaeon]